MLKKIDVLMTRHSQYGVLHHFTQKIYEAFQRTGIPTRLLVGDDVVTGPAMDRPTLTVGFNGAPRDTEMQMLCDILRLPHLSLLVDPPYRFQYLTSSPYTMIGCDDKICCGLLENIGFKRHLFIPHAVEAELALNPPQERIFDIVMLATFIDYKFRREQWKQKFPPHICKIMDEAAEVTFSDPKISFITAFHEILMKEHKKHPNTTYEPAFLSDVLQDLELYIKGKDRALLAKSLRDRPVHIFGGTIDRQDWKTYLGKKHSHILCHGSINYPQVIKIMQQAKIVINPSLKNKEGGHERIFTGLVCGALVATNQSLFLDETFEKDQGLVYYQHGHLDQLNSILDFYLTDEKKRSKETSKGCEIVLKEHTWDQRVQSILRIIPSFLKDIL